MIKLKQGVTLNGIQPEMVAAMAIVASVYSWLDYDCIPTSCTDGEHSAGSLHYTGLAMDFRTRIVPEGERPKLRDAVAQALGDEYDVVLEATHLHVEFDPK